MTEDDGTGIGRSQLTITLGRGDLGAKLECHSSSPTLSEPMIAFVEVDVHGEFFKFVPFPGGGLLDGKCAINLRVFEALQIPWKTS